MNIYFQTLARQELYRSEAAIVQQNWFYRWLTFQNQSCIQTLIRRRNHAHPAMPYLLPFTWAARHQPGTVCLLGLGGGAAVHVLAAHSPHHPITAVESCAEVITLGQQYFWLKTLTQCNIVHQEAQDFMATHTAQTYQHILIDLYSNHSFPQTCAQLKFFQDCKQRLAPNGFLAMNLVDIQRELKVLEILKSVFAQTNICIPVPKTANTIVLAAHNKSNLLNLIGHQSQVKSFFWDPTFGSILQLKQPKLF